MKRGGRNAERALFWTLAVAAFVIAAAGFGARTADRAAAAYDDQRNNYALVRVIAPDGAAGMAAAEAALDHAPHVSSAAPMTQRRAAQLLREWGGADVANTADMPPLRLIEIDLDSTGAQGDVAGDIEAALAQGGVTAQVVRAPNGGAGAGLAGNTRIVAWGAAGLFALVMALLISLAARSLSARREDLATVMTDMGATTAQVAARVGDEAAIMGVQAGALGAVSAGIVAIIALWLLMPGASAASLRALIAPLDLAPLLIAPLLTAVAAGAGARAGAETASVQAARLA